MSNNHVVVLGASDPEMSVIEALLTEVGVRYVYATADGRRVHPGSAYRADPVSGATHWVECAPVGGHPDGAVVIDHHRPGDPGYGRPPSEFLAASSLGQVIATLARLGRMPRAMYWVDVDELPRPQKNQMYATGWILSTEACLPQSPASRAWDGHSTPYLAYGATSKYDHIGAMGYGHTFIWSGWAVQTLNNKVLRIPPPLVLCAAADHCLGAAYRGECPGVDPDELMQWRAKSRADYQKRSVKEVLADIEAATEYLQNAPMIEIGPVCGPDSGDGQGYCPVCGMDGTPDCPCTLCSVRAADMRMCPECLGHGYANGTQSDDEGPCHGGPYGLLPEMPEAAMRAGIAYVSGPIVCPDGRHKYTCSGQERHVCAFLDCWAPAQGLVDTYGDPARGFAGGYMPEI